MKVQILDYYGWDSALHCARKTQNSKVKFEKGKEPSLDFKKRLLFSNHSPLREVRLLIDIDLMNKTQNHLVRHNIGAQWFVSTLRSDIVDSNDIEVTRETERSLVMSVNLSALVNMCRVRTCRVSEKETVDLFNEIIKKVVDLDPLLFGRDFFRPDCNNCKEAFKDCTGKRMDIGTINYLMGL